MQVEQAMHCMEIILDSKTAHSSKTKLACLRNKRPAFTTRAQYVKHSIRNENLFCFFQWFIRYLNRCLLWRFMSKPFFIMSVSDLWMKEWDAKELFRGKSAFLFGNASLPVRFTAEPCGTPRWLFIVSSCDSAISLVKYTEILSGGIPLFALVARCQLKVSIEISEFPFFYNMLILCQLKSRPPTDWMNK